MKNIILSIMIVSSLALSSCAGFKPNDARVFVKPIVTAVSVNYIEKHQNSIPKILALAETLELAADAFTGQLTKEGFLSLVAKIDDDKEWRILGASIWDIYIQNSKPLVEDKNVEALRDISSALRDSVLITSESK